MSHNPMENAYRTPPSLNTGGKRLVALDQILTEALLQVIGRTACVTVEYPTELQTARRARFLTDAAWIRYARANDPTKVVDFSDEIRAIERLQTGPVERDADYHKRHEQAYREILEREAIDKAYREDDAQTGPTWDATAFEAGEDPRTPEQKSFDEFSREVLDTRATDYPY